MEDRTSYIWRDINDADQFHFGIKLKSSGRFIHWCTLTSDGVSDLFGQEASEAVKQVTTTPQVTKLTMDLSDF